MSEQVTLPGSLWRGGTSRALFFREEHLPPPGVERERWLRLALGTQDPRQVDGLGGAQVNTSKVAIISPPSHPQADLDYLAGLAAPGADVIHYDNNCGNILSAVGPYALDQGLLKAHGNPTRVRIFNRNEKALIDAYVPVDERGQARVRGDFVMPGVPGSGAPIFLDFSHSLGDSLLPTGQPQEILDGIPVSLVRGAAVCLLVAASSLGIEGQESAADLNHNQDFLDRAARLHQLGGERLGRIAPGQINQSASPFVVCLSGHSPDLRVRVVGLGRCHPALAATVALTLGLACQISGSLACGPEEVESLRLHHPTGVMEVFTQVASRHPLQFARLGYQRTARKLMEGQIYLPLESFSMA